MFKAQLISPPPLSLPTFTCATGCSGSPPTSHYDWQGHMPCLPLCPQAQTAVVVQLLCRSHYHQALASSGYSFQWPATRNVLSLHAEKQRREGKTERGRERWTEKQRHSNSVPATVRQQQCPSNSERATVSQQQWDTKRNRLRETQMDYGINWEQWHHINQHFHMPTLLYLQAQLSLSSAGLTVLILRTSHWQVREDSSVTRHSAPPSHLLSIWHTWEPVTDAQALRWNTNKNSFSSSTCACRYERNTEVEVM